MNTTDYSIKIADAVKNYLDNNNWHYFFDEKTGMIHFDCSIKGKMREVSCVIRTGTDCYTVHTISPVSADCEDRDMMNKMAEFICRSNYGLKTGNFEFDFTDGEISYKVNVYCGKRIPDEDIIERSLFCPLNMFSRYGDGILSVIFNGKNASDAVEKCQKKNESKSHALIEQIPASEDSDTSE